MKMPMGKERRKKKGMREGRGKKLELIGEMGWRDDGMERRE
jgi:hypothetical protein